ncbi:MAG: glucose 1-dehydrogenase [Bacteroidia bacterium]|nr:glucose 1-dehydrogenase [Bacteroidia bacterium]
MEKNFSGKTVLVTGAASGIGKSTARLFAQKGGKVVVADVNVESGRETVAEITSFGGEAVFFEANVGNAEAVNQMINFAVSHFGSLDIAVNNAGVGGPRVRLGDIPAEDFHQIMNINLNGVFYCMQAEIRHMLKAKGGVIVNVSSVAGMRALPLSAAYSASKHAVLGLTRTAAVEYSRKNIRINAVCPVFTRSAMVDKMFEIDPRLEEKLVQAIPLGRYGEPQDIASAIAWLCSSETTFITGLCLPIDGGLTA